MQTLDYAAISTLVIGLVKVATTVGLPTRYAGLLSIILATVITVVGTGLSDMNTILIGVGLGLTASGAYSGTKALVQG